MMNELPKHPRFAIGLGTRRLFGYGVAFGLAVAVFAPADLSAAPIASVVNGQSQSPISRLSRDNLLPVHCCHSHPYAPYDDYCCHGGAPVARAAVGAAVAYGTYRGVKHHVKHHHKHHSHSKPRRRR